MLTRLLALVLTFGFCACSSSSDDGPPDAAGNAPTSDTGGSAGDDDVDASTGPGEADDASVPPGRDAGEAGADGGAGEGGAAPPTKDAGTSAKDAGADAGSAPPPASHLSAGCGRAAAATGLLHPTPLMINGRARTWELTVPAGYVASEGHAFTTAFHGNTGTGDHIRETFKFENESGETGLFAYPDGNSSGSPWNVEEDGEDLAFWDAIRETVEATYCVDTSRVFMAGFSAGTYPTNFFSCYRNSVVRAVASVSGGFWNAETGVYGPPPSCPQKMPAYVAHGTADKTVPFQWGEDTRDDYAKADACGSATSPAALDPTNCISYDGCASGTAVLWCTHSGAHVVTAFESTDIWKFFSGFQ